MSKESETLAQSSRGDVVKPSSFLEGALAGVHVLGPGVFVEALPGKGREAGVDAGRRLSMEAILVSALCERDIERAQGGRREATERSEKT